MVVIRLLTRGGIQGFNACTEAQQNLIGELNKVIVTTVCPNHTITLGSDVVLIDRPNTYNAGQKQTFGPNGTNAGLNLGSFFGIPSALINGDMWYDTDFEVIRARIFGRNSIIAVNDTDNFFDATQHFNPIPAGPNLVLDNQVAPAGLVSGAVWRESPDDLKYRGAGGVVHRIIINNRNNSYVAGSRQTFIGNATRAGLNIASIAANPSALVSGDMWRLTSQSNIIRYFNAGAIRSLVDLNISQTLLNKIMDYNSNTFQNVPLMSLGFINGTPLAIAKATTSQHPVSGIGTAGPISDIEFYAPVAGTVTQLRTFVPSTSNHTSTCTITVKKNGVLQTLLTSYTSGLTGLQTDLVNTFTVIAGDRISLEIANPSAGGGNRDFDVSMVGLMIES